jgi:hypothetical protein
LRAYSESHGANPAGIASKALLFCSLAIAFVLLAESAWSQNALTPSRIRARVDESRRVVLSGNTPPIARPENDRGAAPDGLAMDRMILLLNRSPEQNAALETLLEEQLDPHSANYRAWLTPEEFGDRFGPSAADIEQVEKWLAGHGFAVSRVASGRNVIEFSGTAGQVREAFHAEIHKFAAGGEEHWANARDPEIPAALAPVVAGVASLNDIPLRSMHKTFGPVVRHGNSAAVTPQFDVALSGGEYYGLAPYDFATQYNILPLWNAGITGTGQSIAIVGQSDIKAADIASFRKAFGLPASAPDILVNGADPGTIVGDEEESDLDVEWAGAVAKGATIKFVTSASTNTTSGVVLSAQYIVDKKVANILSMSYGACEEGLGTTENQLFNSLWQQAAGEGITVFVAAGDSGSAGCDQHGQSAPSPAHYGLQVNGVASTPYNVAVGGTDLSDFNPVGGANTFSTYWATTNNATTGASLKKYVPETVWNDTCTLLNETACNNYSNISFVTTTGGGGGKSSCTVFTTATQTCSGGYAKPTWQKGTGVPADGKRDIPDLSLFSGDGLRHSFYLICDTDVSSDGSCNYSNTNDVVALAVGGTSASSPAMAGIQALINQSAKAAQGNINPTLYSLAAGETLSGCNSTNGSGSACIFNDVTAGTNSMPCLGGTPNCQVTTTGDEYGILSGYTAGTGFDLASGWGSVNAYNLVNKWPGVAVPKVTLSAASAAFGNQAKGTTSPAKTITLTNSGSAALTGVTVSLAGADPADFVETNNCPATVAVGGKCTLTLEFKPASTASYTASVSIQDNASGSPQTISLTGTGTTPAPAATLSATSVAFPNQARVTTSAATAVTLTNSGSAVLSGIVITLGGTNPADFAETNNCAASLAVAAKCTINVSFKPAAAASYKAAVSIKDNAAGSPQTIALSGTGVIPAPAAVLSATSEAFGNQAKGTASASRAVTLTNSGTAVLSGIAITLGGTNPAAFVETSNCAASLAIAAKCTITLEFKPATAAAYTAKVSIADNAAGSPQTITLSGTGFTPAPKVTLSAASVPFANQVQGTTSAARTVTLTNGGTAALTGLSVSLGGANPADFVETNNCGASVAVSAMCTVTLEFKPAAAAAYAATVSIKDNAVGSPQTIALSGTGIQSPLTGTIVLDAGEFQKSGYSGNNGPATKALFYYAEGTAEGPSGNLFVADSGNNVIRKINTATGVITTVAGNGQGAGMVPGPYSGDGGPAIDAGLGSPFGVAVDHNGNIYIADTFNSAIRKVTASTGIITTVAGNGTFGYTGDGGPATEAELSWPKSVALDPEGNIYISDSSNAVIRKVTVSTGKISTIAGLGGGCAAETDAFGDGCPAVDAYLEVAGYITGTAGIAVDSKGNVFLADPDVETVREIHASTGIITVVAGISSNASGGYSGNGGPAVDAQLSNPRDVKVDGSGNVFIADAGNNIIREVSAATGKIGTVAGIQYASGGGKGIAPDTSPTAVTFDTPGYISIDPSGNVFITDINDFVVYKVYGIATPLPVN